MSLGDHLEELRKRLFASIGILILFASACAVFSFRLHAFLTAPYRELTGLDLFLGNAYGPLEIIVKLSIMSGFTLALPLLFAILWGFITPAVTPRSARTGYAVILSSAFLFWAGLCFCWFYIFPISLQFLFVDMLPEGVLPQLTMEKYYSFLFLLHIGSGLFFQLPLIIVLLGALEIIPFSWHARSYRYVIVGIFVVAAVVTPPDPLSQIIMGTLLVLLYAISLVIVYVLERIRRRKS